MKIKIYLSSRIKIIPYLYNEYKYLISHLGSNDSFNNKEKFKALIIKNAHVVEKGLSLKDTKIGFGESKLISLLEYTKQYFLKYSDYETLYFVYPIVSSYIEFNRLNGVENNVILSLFNELEHYIDKSTDLKKLRGGVKRVYKKDILLNSSIPYEFFVKCRYSIRNFTGKSIDFKLIDKALEIAEYTPSACNRQPWHNHIFLDKKKIIEILDFQTGARQFKNDLACVILVTSSVNPFSISEYHQHYVNGGLYAMNLIFALHSLGLGTVPLNMGLDYKKLKRLKDYCEIRGNEVPIMMIGVGDISDDFYVAESKRFPYTGYTKKY